MKLPSLLQPRIIKEAIKALIKGPYTSKFPFKPHTPFERFRGKPEFHHEECVGCGACVQVCPAGALSLEDKGDKRILTVRWDTCIFCGNCQANCLTEKGIILSKEFDLATTGKREELFQSIEKELVRCSFCKEIIAPSDQLIWVAKKLGTMLFSNTSLMLFYLSKEKLAEIKSLPDKELPTLRSDRFHILCPKCRREAVIKS
ncbi:MAG: 4Fe-4S dicluster domain-containing protein [Candidatus Omnitrophica bacterium]|nr:4Fe-4S dicluster domain-containing protein [Candidatus Omnitrophota bacterium]